MKKEDFVVVRMDELSESFWLKATGDSGTYLYAVASDDEELKSIVASIVAEMKEEN